MYDDIEAYKAKDRQITIMRNGNSSLSATIKISHNLKFSDLKRVLEEKLEIKNSKLLRLFTDKGVEIYEDDLEFLKNGTGLYASKGEEFDQHSCFSEYEIQKKLGEGGFGKVVLGVHKKTKQKVAIKIVNTSLIGNAQDIDMVFREVEMLKSLNHKNIVKILNCYTLKNMEVIIVMEFLEGGELLDYVLEKGRLDESEARIFFKQIVDAITYIHQEKLIHRDLKLENLLLTTKNDKLIKVVDFGIAGVNANANTDNSDAGSLSYLAPELLQKKPNCVSPLLDVWAIGIILYGMVCGELPFQGKDNKDKFIAENIIKGEFSYPPEIAKKLSKEIKDLIKKILNANPAGRITLNEIYEHPWMHDKKLPEVIIEEDKNIIPIEEEDVKPLTIHKNSSGIGGKSKSPSQKFQKNSFSPASKSPTLNSLKKGSMPGEKKIITTFGGTSPSKKNTKY